MTSLTLFTQMTSQHDSVTLTSSHVQFKSPGNLYLSPGHHQQSKKNSEEGIRVREGVIREQDEGRRAGGESQRDLRLCLWCGRGLGGRGGSQENSGGAGVEKYISLHEPKVVWELMQVSVPVITRGVGGWGGGKKRRLEEREGKKLAECFTTAVEYTRCGVYTENKL